MKLSESIERRLMALRLEVDGSIVDDIRNALLEEQASDPDRHAIEYVANVIYAGNARRAGHQPCAWGVLSEERKKEHLAKAREAVRDWMEGERKLEEMREKLNQGKGRQR